MRICLGADGSSNIMQTTQGITNIDKSLFLV